MRERIVNILGEGDSQHPEGYRTIYRAVNDQHEALLSEPESGLKIVSADASPLACPLMGDSSSAKFSEENAVIPTWIGMKNRK